jgi:type IX secretion system PorP/SprF family membrane protein
MSKKIKSSFIKFLWLCTIQGISIPLLYGQQEANFSLYMFNHQAINPAYTGTHDYTQITLVNHSQWLKIEGAPQTQALSVSNQFSNKVGLGISLVNDQIGPTQKTNASIDFGYRLNLNKQNLKLSLGLKVSNRFNTIDYSILNLNLYLIIRVIHYFLFKLKNYYY